MKREGTFYPDGGEDRRDGYLESIKLVEEGDGYDPDKKGEMVLFAENQYDKLLQKHSAGKDLGDPAVAQEVLDKVEEDLNNTILNIPNFAPMMENLLKAKPVAGAMSGLSDAYGAQQDAITQRYKDQADEAGLVTALSDMEDHGGTPEAVVPNQAGIVSTNRKERRDGQQGTGSDIVDGIVDFFTGSNDEWALCFSVNSYS